jgi:hypothetical protein
LLRKGGLCWAQNILRELNLQSVSRHFQVKYYLLSAAGLCQHSTVKMPIRVKSRPVADDRPLSPHHSHSELNEVELPDIALDDSFRDVVKKISSYVLLVSFHLIVL